MKASKLLLLFLALMVVSASALAYSVSIVWTMNKPNYEVELYPCSNSDCSSVGSRIIFATAQGYTYNMYYTASGNAYHAAYFYKSGYRPIGYTLNSWGDWSTSFSNSFVKKDYCKSSIGTLSVSDSTPTVGETIILSAPVSSAFTTADDHPQSPDYYPSSHADYFTSDIDALLKVYSSSGSLVMTLPSQAKSIYQDGTQTTTFSLDTASLSPGIYKIVLSTDPVDSICNQNNKIIDSKEIWITVSPVPNTPPIIDGLIDYVFFEDSGLHENIMDLWGYSYDAETPDPGLAFTIISQTNTAVAICTIESNRYIDCTTQTNQNGYSDITVQVRDPQGLTDTDTFRIRVSPVNDAPVVSDIPGQTIDSCHQFTTFDLDDYVMDVDNNDAELAWTVTGNTQLVVSIDSATHVVTITYPTAFTGSETLTFTARDPQGLTASDTATFTITQCTIPNNPPVISDVSGQTIDSCHQFTTFDLDNYVTDVDNSDGELTWTVSGNAQLIVTIDPSTHIATIFYPAGFVGSEVLTFTVTDPQGLTDSDDATYTVTQCTMPNNPPVISDIPGQTITSCNQFATFDLNDYVADPDDTDAELTWTVTGNTNLHVSIAQDHVVTITYSCGWIGAETLAFTVTDPKGLTDSDTAVFTVTTQANTPPVIEGLPDKTFEEDSGNHNNVIDLWDYASDAETPDSGLTFTITEETNKDIVDCSIGSDKHIDCKVKEGRGYSYVTVEVKDPQGLTDTDTFKVTIKKAEPEDDGESDDGGLIILSISYDDIVKAGDYMHLSINAKGLKEGIVIAVEIEDLGIYETFDGLSGIYVLIPEDAKEGLYDFHVSIKNEDGYTDSVYKELKVVGKVSGAGEADSDEGHDQVAGTSAAVNGADSFVSTGSTGSTSFYMQGLLGLGVGLVFLLIVLAVLAIVSLLKNKDKQEDTEKFIYSSQQLSGNKIQEQKPKEEYKI